MADPTVGHLLLVTGYVSHLDCDASVFLASKLDRVHHQVEENLQVHLFFDEHVLGKVFRDVQIQLNSFSFHLDRENQEKLIQKYHELVTTLHLLVDCL